MDAESDWIRFSFRKVCYNFLLNLVLTFYFIFACFQESLAVSGQKSLLDSVPGLVIPHDKFQLPNGLTVVVNEDHNTPLVAIRMVYKAGFSNETRSEQYGASYLLQRLMEKGTEHFKENINKALEHAGAVKVNNYTTSDLIVFSATVPTVAIERVLWLESDRMGYMLRSVTDERMESEQLLTEHQIEQRQFELNDIIYDRIAEQSFFPGHPYARPFLGMNDDESGLKLRSVKQWFRRYVVPNNAVLILSGDINLIEAKNYAAKYFGEIAVGPPLKKLTKITEVQTGEKRDSIDGIRPFPVLVKVWDVPAFGDSDLVHLRLAFDMLAGGSKSRFYQRIVIKESLARDVKFKLNERALGSQLVLTAELRDDADPKIAELLLQEEITSFILKGPETNELDRSKLNMVVKLLRMGEQVAGKADMLAMGEVYLGDPSYYHAHELAVRQTNINDIKNILTNLSRQSGYVLEVKAKKAFTTVPSIVSREQPAPIQGKVQFRFPAIEKFRLDNGLNVYLLKRSEASFIEAVLSFDAGISAHEGLPGLPVLAFQHLVGGSDRSKQTFSDVIKTTASQMRMSHDMDASSLHLTLIKASLPQVFKSMTELFMEPQFRSNVFERERNTAGLRARWEKTEPTHFISHVIYKILYGIEHPYSVAWTGAVTPYSLSKINQNVVVNYWKKWIRPDNASLIVAGDMSVKTLKEMLDDTLAVWQPPIAGRVEKIYPAQRSSNGGRAFIAPVPKSRKTTIVAAQLTVPAADDRTVALSLANDIVGDRRSSRLRILFEEEKGWGSDIKSEIKQVRAEQPFIMKATVPSEFTVEAIRLINDIHRRVSTDEPLTSKELAWVRNSRIREMPGIFESNRALVNALETLVAQKLSVDLLPEYSSLITQVTDQAVVKAAAKVFADSDLVWLILGDHKTIASGIRALDFKDVVVLDQTGELPKIDNNMPNFRAGKHATFSKVEQTMPESDNEKTTNAIDKNAKEEVPPSTTKQNNSESPALERRPEVKNKFKPAAELDKESQTTLSDNASRNMGRAIYHERLW